MFKEQKSNNFYLYSTEVENFFISDFMIKAPEGYVKAYLLGLMFARLGAAMDNVALARQLGVEPGEIEDCWEYWEEKGLVKRRNNELSPESGYDVEFVKLRELVGSAAPAAEQREACELDNVQLAKLYKDIQKAAGRMITGAEMREIGNWIADLGVCPELIIYCYAYCASKRRSTAFRYVGTVLKDWLARELRTPEAVEHFLSEYDNRFSSYKAVFTELGFSRNPTAEEKRMMNAWLDDYAYSMDEILSACKQTAGISNPNLKYVDAVLKNSKGAAEEGEVRRENAAVKINRMYESIRKENEAKTEAMRRLVFSKLPRVEVIMHDMGEESIRQTQAMLRRDGVLLAETRRRLEALREEKASLLRGGGFAENATDTVYTCSKCKDTGVLEDGSPCFCYAEKLEKINGEA